MPASLHHCDQQRLCSANLCTETQFSTQNLGWIPGKALTDLIWHSTCGWNGWSTDLRANMQMILTESCIPASTGDLITQPFHLAHLTSSWLLDSTLRHSCPPCQPLRSVLAEKKGPGDLILCDTKKSCSGCLLHFPEWRQGQTPHRFTKLHCAMLLHYNVQSSNSLFNSFLIKFSFIKPK